MRKNLQRVLMATAAIASLLSVAPVFAETSAPIAPSTDTTGRKIYTNDVIAPAPRQTVRAQQHRLAFWSATEHRWKPVPRAKAGAAKSAADEVGQYLGRSLSQHNSSQRTGFTPAEIDAAIEKAASRHNVDANLVRALVKVESNFNPNAVSRKGAMGLMQLMPQTARQLNVTNPFNPEENIDAGVRHLKHLLENYGGNVPLSLAAYNAGEGAVARGAGIPRYAETRNYVRRITHLYGAADSYFGPARQPVVMQRDSRGVLYISNTD